MARMNVPLRCRCGGKTFEMPNTPPRPDDTITCVKCGATGRFADVQKSSVEQAKKLLGKALTDAFLPGGKPRKLKS